MINNPKKKINHLNLLKNKNHVQKKITSEQKNKTKTKKKHKRKKKNMSTGQSLPSKSKEKKKKKKKRQHLGGEKKVCEEE